jgi:hypothetical protein
MAASEDSRNHSVSEKYQTVQSFKLHSLQNSALNYTLLPAVVKALEIFLEAILWKPFQLLRRILMSTPPQKRRPFNADFSPGNRQKSAEARSG